MLPSSDALVWSQGNKWTYRLRPSTYMLAAMLTEAAAKLPARRWVTVAPNYEYGQSAVKWFKQLMSARQPDIQWVGEQWPALGRIDAAIEHYKHLKGPHRHRARYIHA